MTKYAHNYDPPLKYGALITQAEIEGAGSVTWTSGKFTGNGVTTVFTLPSTPASGGLQLFINGQYQTDTADIAPSTGDYSLSGAVITMTIAPLSSDTFIYKYTT